MRHVPGLTRLIRLRAIFCMALVFAFFGATSSFGQVPPRFYWKTLKNTNAFPVLTMALSGNSNPFDPARRVSANAEFDAELLIAGYARTFELFDRATMAAVLLPMGRVSSDVTVAGLTVSDDASGIGDPMLEFVINIVGPKAIRNMPDLMRYEPGFSLDLLIDLGIPIGEYDADESLNIGQNRWFGRVGAPIVWQLGPWVPGKRTTLEFVPSVWFFADNDDFLGEKLETDPMFMIEGHLTRDFTKDFWASLDATWVTGGKATLGGVTGEDVNNIGVGFTFGYSITESLSLTIGYMTTVAEDDLEMDRFMISFTYGWNSLIEGIRRLGEEN